MGIFDKFRGALDTAKNSVLSADKSPTNRYYGVILVLLSTVKTLKKEHIQLFFRSYYNEECDEIALDKALEKFKSSKQKDGQTWYSLTFKQFQNEGKQDPNLTKDMIYEICCKDYIDTTKNRLEEVLAIIKNQPSVSRLNQGIEAKIKDEINYKLPNGKDFPYCYLVGTTISSVFIDKLLNKDETVLAIVADEVCEYIHQERGFDRCYALAMRAFHFKKHEDLSEYTSITKEDCVDAVRNSRNYFEVMKEEEIKNPFTFDKERFIDKKATAILESSTICSKYIDLKSDWKMWASKNVRFVDAACYYALEKMATYFDNSDTTSVEKSFHLVVSFAISDII